MRVLEVYQWFRETDCAGERMEKEEGRGVVSMIFESNVVSLQPLHPLEGWEEVYD